MVIIWIITFWLYSHQWYRRWLWPRIRLKHPSCRIFSDGTALATRHISLALCRIQPLHDSKPTKMTLLSDSHLREVISSLRCLGSLVVRALDLQLNGRGFNPRLSHYRLVSTGMGDCLRASTPPQYLTSSCKHFGQLSLLPSVGRIMSTS